MDGEKKFLVVAVGLVALCITILYAFLFISLWQFKEFVGLSLLVVLLLSAWVFLRGRLTEQELRFSRFHHHTETPVDDTGEPMFWREGYQSNPHRTHV